MKDVGAWDLEAELENDLTEEEKRTTFILDARHLNQPQQPVN
ncbi:MAG: hypothetical protein V3U52_01155 [Thermoplasmata archaeon]